MSKYKSHKMNNFHVIAKNWLENVILKDLVQDQLETSCGARK